MQKKLLLFFICAVLCWGGCAQNSSTPDLTQTTENQKITIVTTLFPLYDFAKNIGEDKVAVTLLLPPGVEPHGFEPKPSDIAKINNADIFVYTGKFMEPWAQDISESLNPKVKIVDSSQGVPLITNSEEKQNETEENDAESHQHHHSGVDPHIWLDFGNAQIMVQNITTALKETDPSHADFYQKNADIYKAKLKELDLNYQQTLQKCTNKNIIYAGHYAFGYLAKRYGVSYSAAQGFSPDSEPSARDLIEMVEQIKKEKIKYIFYEELSSPKIAETLANETSTQMLLLNGAHNLSKDNYENNVSYLSLMEDNLKNLAQGLNCH